MILCVQSRLSHRKIGPGPCSGLWGIFGIGDIAGSRIRRARQERRNVDLIKYIKPVSRKIKGIGKRELLIRCAKSQRMVRQGNRYVISDLQGILIEDIMNRERLLPCYDIGYIVLGDIDDRKRSGYTSPEIMEKPIYHPEIIGPLTIKVSLS